MTGKGIIVETSHRLALDVIHFPWPGKGLHGPTMTCSVQATPNIEHKDPIEVVPVAASPESTVQ